MANGFDGHQSLMGKVAVITGASSGIGEALARRLSAHDVSLALASRSGRSLGLPKAIDVACDVRDLDQVEHLLKQAHDAFDRVDVIVANAGVGSYHPFGETPIDDVDEMIDTNVKGTIYLIRASLPYLTEAGGGDIITVASEAGRRGLPGEAVYSASKFAQVGLSRALDNEFRESNIRCTAVCPGGTATNFAMDNGRGRTPESVRDARMMTADDVTDVIMFALTRPRSMRLMEAALRPMSEASWG